MHTSVSRTSSSSIGIVCIIIRVILRLAGFRLARFRWGRGGVAVLTVHCGRGYILA